LIWRQELANWLEAGLQLLFPACCPNCGAELSQRDAWCQSCLNEIWQPHCLDVTGRGMQHVAACHTLVGYEGTVRTLLHGLKFQRRRGNAAPLAWLLSMADEQELAGLPLRKELVAPVPLSAERQAKRGFNQVELLFADWCGRQGLDWDPAALRRHKPTVPQWELNRLQRRENIKDAFVCNAPEKIFQRHILLVDDIVTTGQTLEACAIALHQAGAASVRALCLAHGSLGAQLNQVSQGH
jgi:ComF family protein